MFRRYYTAFFLIIGPAVAVADGFAVDKVYHPYVQPLEREIEYRSSWLDDKEKRLDGLQLHRLGIGASISDRFFAELYAVGSRQKGSSMALDAFEAELKWQLTEQGEYSADWGLLFEFEVNQETSAREFVSKVLIEKEFGRWAGTLNLGAAYEWGERIKNELESSLAIQWRYRFRQGFEPAIELYSSDAAKGLGPVALGAIRFAGARKLRWETGLIFPLDRASPDYTVRAQLEYEF